MYGFWIVLEFRGDSLLMQPGQRIGIVATPSLLQISTVAANANEVGTRYGMYP